MSRPSPQPPSHKDKAPIATSPLSALIPISSELIGSALGLLAGGVFGFTLEKSQVALPSTIRGQLNFSDLRMLKMFLSATVVGLVVFKFLDRYTGRTRKPKPPVALGLNLFGGYGGNIVGGALLGVGMSLAGACPGTVFAQVGMGVENSLFTLLGGYVGAAVYGFLNPVLKRLTLNNRRPHHQKKEAKALHDVVGSPKLVAGLWVLLLATIIGISEYLHPTLYFLPSSDSIPLTNLSLTAKAWSPFTSGMLIGLLQLPAFYFLNVALGASSSYCTVVGACSTCVPTIGTVDVKEHNSYFKDFLGGTGNIWNLAFVIGAVGGAFLSSTLSGVASNLPSNHGPLQSFIGGMLILFGARLADGCTSGHGVTGLATMALSSIASVSMMFVGGIATSFLFFGGTA